jgi:hypothetical protein
VGVLIAVCDEWRLGGMSGVRGIVVAREWRRKVAATGGERSVGRKTVELASTRGWEVLHVTNRTLRNLGCGTQLPSGVEERGDG